MSIKVMSRVWDHSEQEGGDLLLLLALADWADDDGYCWPKQAQLAAKARCSVRAVRDQLVRLTDAGEIERSDGRGRGVGSTYRVLTGLAETTNGATPAAFAADKKRQVEARKAAAAAAFEARKAAGSDTEKRQIEAQKAADCCRPIENHQDTSEDTSITPAVAGDAQARTRPQTATAAAAAAPAAEGAQGALFAALCRAAGRSPQDVTSGSRAQLDQLVARLLELPEEERPDEDALRETYRATMEALSRQQRREATPLTVGQYREAIFSRIEAARQEAADRQRQAEKALREAEDAARWRQERSAAEAAGPGLAHEGQEAWGKIARELRSRMSPATWDSWLAAAQPLALQDGVLTIQVASSYAVDWITQRLAAPLAALAEELGLEDLRFVPLVPQELAREVRAA